MKNETCCNKDALTTIVHSKCIFCQFFFVSERSFIVTKSVFIYFKPILLIQCLKHYDIYIMPLCQFTSLHNMFIALRDLQVSSRLLHVKAWPFCNHYHLRSLLMIYACFAGMVGLLMRKEDKINNAKCIVYDQIYK